LVINPIAILLYQNFSFLPATASELAAIDLTPQKQIISSTAIPGRVDINKLMQVASPTLAGCKSKLENCLVANQ
jgi:hypothetical protein